MATASAAHRKAAAPRRGIIVAARNSYQLYGQRTSRGRRNWRGVGNTGNICQYNIIGGNQ